MMKKPVGERRTPTDLWSGLGFSKSMPDAEIREWLNRSLCYRGSGMSTTYEVLNYVNQLLLIIIIILMALFAICNVIERQCT